MPRALVRRVAIDRRTHHDARRDVLEVTRRVYLAGPDDLELGLLAGLSEAEAIYLRHRVAAYLGLDGDAD